MSTTTTEELSIKFDVGSNAYPYVLMYVRAYIEDKLCD
jgi:hypothetical protein